MAILAVGCGGDDESSSADESATASEISSRSDLDGACELVDVGRLEDATGSDAVVDFADATNCKLTLGANKFSLFPYEDKADFVFDPDRVDLTGTPVEVGDEGIYSDRMVAARVDGDAVVAQFTKSELTARTPRSF